MMMRLFGTFLLALTAAGCFAAAPEITEPASEKELEDVLTRIDLAANPLKQKITTVHLQLTGIIQPINMQIKMEGFADTVQHKWVKKAIVPGMPGNVELYDGQNAYSITPGIQTKPVTGKKLVQMRHEAETTDPTLKMMEKYSSVKLDKKKYDINGHSCYRLICQPKTSAELPPLELFFDDGTFLEMRSCILISTDMGTIPSVTDFKEYKNVNGIPVPFKMTVKQLNMVIASTIDRVQFNRIVPEKTFDKEAIEDAEE